MAYSEVIWRILSRSLGGQQWSAAFEVEVAVHRVTESARASATHPAASTPDHPWRASHVLWSHHVPMKLL